MSIESNHMADSPAPLTPPDCDLQDFPFMPLQVARLRDSDMAATESPEACWYAVMLWAASWHQVPAASLPDDDAILTKLCGLGRDVKTFRKHRDGALRGFVKCSDGRIYHAVVAEQANAAWAEKAAYRERKAQRIESAQKAAKARWGNTESNTSADAEAMRDACEAHAEGNAQRIETAMPKGTGTGTGTGNKEKEVVAAQRAARLPKDFVVPPDWLEWAETERGWMRRDAETEAAAFCDFWHAKGGKDAAKLDWLATWRNWVRNSRRQSSQQQGRWIDDYPPGHSGVPL